MKKTKLINFKISEADYKQLKAEADKLRIPLSSLIRTKIYTAEAVNHE